MPEKSRRGKLIGSGLIGAVAGLVALVVSRRQRLQLHLRPLPHWDLKIRRTRFRGLSKSVLGRWRRPSRRLRRSLAVPRA